MNATDTSFLLDDDAMAQFIVTGYLLVRPDLPDGAAFHAHVTGECDRLHEAGTNPGNAVYEAIPRLREVFEHPQIAGVLTSLLGHGYVLHDHRHLHTTEAGTQATHWHQDDVNSRHHQFRRLLVMYYPHEVTADMGPTIILPGTYLRNAPTSRMASYVNFKDQVELVVEAGTVAIAHYDIWHTRTPNHSARDRHMLKFLFERTTEPTGPTWRHDPAGDKRIREQFTHTHLGHDGASDAYKLIALRLKLWNWLLGGPAAPTPAADEETVITHYR